MNTFEYNPTWILATLETRNMDSLDFHEVSVGSVKAALRRAFEAGRESAAK